MKSEEESISLANSISELNVRGTLYCVHVKGDNTRKRSGQQTTKSFSTGGETELKLPIKLMFFQIGPLEACILYLEPRLQSKYCEIDIKNPRGEGNKNFY